MKILFLSDLHYHLPGKPFHEIDESVAFSWLEEVVETEKPDLILSAGDWGVLATPGMFRRILMSASLYTVYGNHDSDETLKAIMNLDLSPCLLKNGRPRVIGGILRVGGIGGNFGLGRRWYHVRHEQFPLLTEQLAARGLDMFITHEPPELYAPDRKVRFGWAEVTRAVEKVRPKLHLCGHFHCDSILAKLGPTVILKLDSSQTRKQYAVADYCEGGFQGLELKKLSEGKVKVLASRKDAIDVQELTRVGEGEEG